MTVWVGHHYELVETPVFLWVLGVVALLAALSLLLAGFAFSRLWNFGDRGGRDLTAGALIAMLVLVPYGVVAYRITSTPPLRDISTDLEEPPVLGTAATRTKDMNTLTAPTPGEQRLQAENYPLVVGRSYSLPLDDVVVSVEAVLKRQGWKLVLPVPAGNGRGEVTMEAVAKSFVLELPADVAVRVRDDGDTTLVDMRSASRYGRHDLGDGAARIIAFLADLDQEIAVQAGMPAAE